MLPAPSSTAPGRAPVTGRTPWRPTRTTHSSTRSVRSRFRPAMPHRRGRARRRSLRPADRRPRHTDGGDAPWSPAPGTRVRRRREAGGSMHIGVTAFLTDRAMGPGALAVAVEERGYHSLYLPEHTHLPVGSAPPALVDGVHLEDYRRSLDPLAALATAAALTDRILLGTGIALVAQHDPIVLAKLIATIDHLSGGRFVLGMGYGWNSQEAADHGVAFADRRAIAR